LRNFHSISLSFINSLLFLVINTRTITLHQTDSTTVVATLHRIDEVEEQEMVAEETKKLIEAGDSNTLTIINISILTTTTITTELFSQLKTSKSDSLFIIS
jgi:hypothetical protein